MASSDRVPEVDVFICGAGPVGLLLAYQLTKFGVSTYTIDSANKASPDFPMYGRASTLYPRSLEMLDQLDLYDDMAQVGLASSRAWSYRDGKRVPANGWDRLVPRTNTYFNFLLNIRLKFSEDIFREKLVEMGAEVHAPLKLVGYEIDENAADEYKISIECERTDERSVRVRSKYIVGADGGKSAVRKIAQIPFPGLHQAQHWVRIDGVVTSDIPEARTGFGNIESSTHGSVLWVALDHGATRIGYVLSDDLFEKYGINMTQAQAVHEAKIACAPAKIDFEEVHWHTVYGIQQHVADRFVDQGRIMLAGEAAHTHSSGTAQGMNTGVHDAVSLGWRLAGVIKGWYKQPVLENYSDERRAVALDLIENDKIISALIHGVKPSGMRDRRETTNEILQEFLDQVQGFTNGLDIFYQKNLLNDVENCFPSIKTQPGWRGSDVLLRKVGLRQHPVRLFELTRYNGKFRVLIFAGQPTFTLSSLRTLRSQVDQDQQRFKHAVDFITIIDGLGQAFDEMLGVPKFGKAYWDIDSSAHWAYGALENQGAMVVLRPDGIVGASAPLSDFEDVVVPYLDRLINNNQTPARSDGISTEIGELINQTENNLEFSKSSSRVGIVASR